MKRFTPAILLFLAVGMPPAGAAQDFAFEPPAQATDPELAAAMHDLAERVLPTYQEDDPGRYLSTLAALQIAVGDAAAANTTRRTLRERLQSEQGIQPAGRAVVYDIYVEARAAEATEDVPFSGAYGDAFQATLSSLDDLAAYELEDLFTVPAERLQQTLQGELDKRRGTPSVTLDEALDLVRAWFAFEAYRSFDGLVRPLLAEDAARRYVFEDVAVPVAEDATIAVALVRPRSTADSLTLPTLLEVTLDRSSRDVREAAAHGYASVLALARIAGDPSARPRAPFESEGEDARALIEWIAQQPWSDGRVGMQGVGYGGFVAWSAAKRRPPALQAIATSDPMAPGIDVPNPNGVFSSSAYRWVYEILAAPGDEAATDDARWRGLSEDWYRSGRRYRDLPTLPGRASAVFRSWLNHPSYDGFWRKWLPFGTEFATIDIPVLTVTGYYTAGQTGAWHYFEQHHRQRADADHSLLIGPFDEQGIRQGASSVRGVDIDPVARIDAGDVRYVWLNHVLRDAERPEILSATINYQLAGANEWRHEPSLTALQSNLRRFFLAAAADAPYRLVEEEPAEPMSLAVTVDLRDRTDASWRPTQELVLSQAEPRAAALFMTEPLAEPLDLAGRLRGELDFTINKYDVDLVVMLYELRPEGDYVKLFDPPYIFRASYARDRVNRRLLIAGVRQQLPFQSDRMVGRRLAAGSRLVMALGINKRADQQINYGAGNDVSEEAIEDAGNPMRIRLHEGSFIEIPATAPIPESSPAPELPQ